MGTPEQPKKHSERRTLVEALVASTIGTTQGKLLRGAGGVGSDGMGSGAAALGSSFLPQPTKAMVAATAVKPAHWSRERLVFIVMREPPG